MPSVLSEGGPGKARAGCGGDPYRRRTGYDERYPLSMRVGDDALIVPLGPTTGRVVKYPPFPSVRSRGDVGIAPYANGGIFRSTEPDRML